MYLSTLVALATIQVSVPQECGRAIELICSNRTEQAVRWLEMALSARHSDPNVIMLLSLSCREANMYRDALAQLSVLEILSLQGGDHRRAAWSAVKAAEILHDHRGHECALEQYRYCLDKYGADLPSSEDIAGIVLALERGGVGTCSSLAVPVACAEDEDMCVATSVASVLRYWGDNQNEASAYDVLDPNRGFVSLSSVLDLAPQMAGYEAVPFIANHTVLQRLLNAGCPVLIEYEGVDDKGIFTHVTVINGYCDLGRRFTVKDPNWALGWSSLGYEDVEGCYAVALAPYGVLASILAGIRPLVDDAVLLELAEDLLSAKSVDDAEFIFRLLRDMGEGSPQGSWGAHGLARCAYARGDYQEAGRFQREAVEGPPFSCRATQWELLADIYVSVDDNEGAIGAYRKALDRDDRRYSVYQKLAHLMAKYAYYDSARDYCVRMSQLWPGDRWVNQMLSFLDANDGLRLGIRRRQR